MAHYAVIPGGPSPEMNPGCSGPFIILDPETSCLYVWDDFAKQYVAFCLDDSAILCDVPEIPLETGTFVLTCTPSANPQEGKASVFELLSNFFSALCAQDGTGTTAQIIETPGPIGEGTWCVQVDIRLGDGLIIDSNNNITVDVGDGSGGIVINNTTNNLELDACLIEDAVIGNILDMGLCDVKMLGQYIGQGSECLTRNFTIGELNSRYLEAGANITINYDPATCKTTITGADAPPMALTPGLGTVPGGDGTSLDLSICTVNYVGAAPAGARTIACVNGDTVLVDYVPGGGGPGGGIIVVGGGEGIDVTTEIIGGDAIYTISLDLCDIPTETGLVGANNIFIPLCVDGVTGKYTADEFEAAIIPTFQAGGGINILQQSNPGGSDDYTISLDACSTVDSNHVPGGKLLACVGGSTRAVPAYTAGPGITVDSAGVITNTNLEFSVPIGGIMPYGGLVPPSGWYLCNGDVLIQAANPDLFSVLGTTYGGDATTFRLPDFRGRNVRGVNNMGGSEGPGYPGRTVVGATGGAPTLSILTVNMPNHTHTGTVSSAGGHIHGGSTTNSGAHTHTGNSTADSGNHAHTTRGVNQNGVDVGGGFIAIGVNGYLTGYAGLHRHNFNVSSNSSSHSHSFSMTTAGAHTHTFTSNSSGGSEPIEQASPFIDMNYIIKA